jgi:hypothetical protein
MASLFCSGASGVDGGNSTYRENTDGVDSQLIQISVTHDGGFLQREKVSNEPLESWEIAYKDWGVDKSGER